MKKKNIFIIIMGTIALLLNVLFPTLSFGQSETQTQTPTVLLSCGPYGISLGSDAFHMKMKSEGGTNRVFYGDEIGGKPYQNGNAVLPGEAYIKITDFRTEMQGCAEEGVDGWHIDVAPKTTPVWSDGQGKTFTPTDFKIVTTMNFDTSASGADINGTHYAYNGPTLQTYIWMPTGISPVQNFTLPFNVSINSSIRDLTGPDCFNLEGCTGAGYEDANDISNGTVTIVDNSGGTGLYVPGTFYTAVAYRLIVPAAESELSEYPYSNTIEFTMVIAD